MSFVLVKTGNVAVLCGTPDGQADIEQVLLPDDELGEHAVKDWPAGVSPVEDDNALNCLRAIVVEESDVSPPAGVSDGSVRYKADKVTAYFDNSGRSVIPSFATWAKVWTPDGKMAVVDLDEIPG